VGFAFGTIEVVLPAFSAEEGQRDHEAFLANLAFGVTTSHDPSNDTVTVFTNAEMVRALRVMTVERGVDPRRDLGGGLPVRDAVRPERPALPLLPYLGGLAAFVGAVVPLAELVARLRFAEPGEPGRLGRARQGTREHAGEAPPLEGGPERLRLLPPTLGQRDVGVSRVPAVPAPLGLAVPGEHDLRRHVDLALRARDDAQRRLRGRRVRIEVGPGLDELVDRVARRDRS
jgi:hypothetical protein